jgi:hypothetical protein
MEGSNLKSFARRIALDESQISPLVSYQYRTWHPEISEINCRLLEEKIAPQKLPPNSESLGELPKNHLDALFPAL